MVTNKQTVEEKIQQLDLNTLSAQKWAKEGQVEAWVHKYLTSGTGGETNAAFSDSLKRAKRWWNGPIKLNLDDLAPAVGTDSKMEYVVDAASWQAWTTRLADSFSNPLMLPPLIIEYRAGELSIRDGNTRYGAMQHLGWRHCWVIIWYNSADDYDEHNRTLFESAQP